MQNLLFHQLLEFYDTQTLLQALLCSLLPTVMVKPFLKVNLAVILGVCMIGLSQIPVILAQNYFSMTVCSALLFQLVASYFTEVIRLQEFDIMAIAAVDSEVGDKKSTKGKLKALARTFSCTCLLGCNVLLPDDSYT